MTAQGYIDPDDDDTMRHYPNAEPTAAIAALNEALAKAQGEFPDIKRERTVEVQTKTGGKYTFSYAPLDLIMSTVRPTLAKHGLSVVQILEPGPSLRTELRHAAGGVIGGSFPFTAPENAQQLGSLITYLRRYCLVALLGLTTEEDDDGSKASGNESRSVPTPEKETPATVNPVTNAQHAKIGALVKKLGEGEPEGSTADWTVNSRLWIQEQYGKKSRAQLTTTEAGKLIEYLEEQLEAQSVPFG